jgi:hypothetical protein
LLNAASFDDMRREATGREGEASLESIDALLAQPRGIAVPVSKAQVTLNSFVAAARRVENRVPDGANWNGKDELLVTAEEFEAVRSGAVTPKKEAAPQKKNRSAPANASGGGAPAGSR